MRVLEGETIWRRNIEGRALAFRDRSNEVRAVIGGRSIGAFAADQIDRVVLQVVSAGPGTFVGICYRAPALESPFARSGYRTVDAARAGGGGRYNAAVRRIKAVGDLHHHGHVPLSASL